MACMDEQLHKQRDRRTYAWEMRLRANTGYIRWQISCRAARSQMTRNSGTPHVYACSNGVSHDNALSRMVSFAYLPQQYMCLWPNCLLMRCLELVVDRLLAPLSCLPSAISRDSRSIYVILNIKCPKSSEYMLGRLCIERGKFGRRCINWCACLVNCSCSASPACVNHKEMECTVARNECSCLYKPDPRKNVCSHGQMRAKQMAY
jgi:hypothetical protein